MTHTLKTAAFSAVLAAAITAGLPALPSYAGQSSATAELSPAEKKAQVAQAKADQAARSATSRWTRQIGRRLDRHMSYPASAQLAKEYGHVEYELVVDRSGHVHSAQKITSSGFSRLDQASAETIADMKQLPSMPTKMTAEQAQVVIRMVYLPADISRPGMRAPIGRARTDLLDLARSSSVKVTPLG